MHFSGFSAIQDCVPRPPRHFYRRNLPHIQKDTKAHFVSFSTHRRWQLPAIGRDIVLQCAIHDHERKIDLYIAVVMPEHVHMIFNPLVDGEHKQVRSLADILNGIKGASAHKVNKVLDRKGKLWQEESFDHVLRSSESLDQKVEYVRQNPVRRGLVSSPGEYPWLWVAPRFRK